MAMTNPASQAQLQSVGGDAPAGSFIGVQQLLNEQARRPLTMILGELIEAAVESFPRSGDGDGHAAAQGHAAHGKDTAATPACGYGF